MSAASARSAGAIPVNAGRNAAAGPERRASPDYLRYFRDDSLSLAFELSREWHCYVPRPGWKTVYCVLAIKAGS